MILTTHILSGAALGANIPNPYAVAGLSIVLHFLQDTLPHGDYLNKKSRLREFWKVAVDLAIGLSLVTAIVFYKNWLSDEVFLTNISTGIFFSLFPDFTTFLYRYLNMKFLRPIKDFHEGLHCYENGSRRREFRIENGFWDIFITLASLLFLLFLCAG
ncbi:MAG: hypothetical protein A2359_03755 [Candidatus Moranbacteria bacterium RIFOXYB1_FULL_43_19]|nr:MAG: hypothetical protein A2184_02325 [Candidatus Moranbacteria bacterium RIFOXYA1_FULL_44_7]OGI26760.1 MAG: hypothetical protein A2359_03755 [Candidatus Moranbacteria bacterium RIFOXYB1_FULL_43_19]OGI32487.1 MAG: hypothetical protein A2420_03940 [Candidatus Moranbacteria bacterium RIFOXYC1_FULL_44_13]OGI37994.1 MAG: hypothetical protein A2612_03415 [Candidatus Moranbacteria bacterium RIFOXYD1_FULL_44_12]